MDFKFVTLETFIIQFIIIIFVFYVLNKYIFQPYLAYLDDIEKKQKKVEEDYKNIETITKDAQEKANDALVEARQKGEAIIQEAESIAKKKREDIILKAEGDAKDLLDSGKHEIEKERIGMVNSLKGMVVGLMMKLHTKILKNEKVSQDFIEKALEGITH